MSRKRPRSSTASARPVRRAAPELVASGEDDLEDLDRFLARSQAVTGAFAREHRQREIPIVG